MALCGSLSGSLSGSLWLSLALSLAHSGSLWLSLAHSGSHWLSLAHSGSLWLTVRLSLALSCSLWLSLALPGSLSGSLWLPLALSGALWLSEFAYKALAWLTRPLLGYSLLRYSTFFSPDQGIQSFIALACAGNLVSNVRIVPPQSKRRCCPRPCGYSQYSHLLLVGGYNTDAVYIRLYFV